MESNRIKRFSNKVCQLLRISGIFITLSSIVLGILAPWVIKLLFGDEFIPSAPVLVYLIPGVLLLTIFKVLNMDLAGRGKPWLSMKAMVPALVGNIVLNIFWVPEFGAKGAAVASTLSYSLAAILFLGIYSKEVNIPIREMLRYRRNDFKFVFLFYQKKKHPIYYV